MFPMGSGTICCLDAALSPFICWDYFLFYRENNFYPFPVFKSLESLLPFFQLKFMSDQGL
jgi:hypothetical protein